MITFKEFLGEVLTDKKAEMNFMFGDCTSFAIALQDVLGKGEFYLLLDRGKPLHAFLKVGDTNIDVKGQRSTQSMALSIVGTIDAERWSVKGPVQKSKLPFKQSARKIAAATEYIKAHLRKFS